MSGVVEESLLVEGCGLGARIDPAGEELRDPRLEAPAPDVPLDAPDELEPDELPPTWACAAIVPASNSENAIEY
jgi:hypothetical protein